MSELQPGEATQFAYVTHDLERTANGLVQVMGAGPFFLSELSDVTDRRWVRTYRGGPALDTVRIALGFIGKSMIEIVQPTNDEPSLFREFLDTRGEVLQHVFPRIAPLTPEEFEARTASYVAAGYPLVYQVSAPGTGLTRMFDSIDKLGVFVELVELPGDSFGAIQAMYRAHRDWDGDTRPLRRMEELLPF